jgi:hypothetical protein
MRQTTEPRYGNDSAACIGILLDLAASGRSLGQREMSSIIAVVTAVLAQQSFQMQLIEHDHVVEQIAATGADPTLCHAVLPRTSKAGSFGMDAKTLYRVDHIAIELWAAIKDQVSRGRVIRKGLAQLLNDPGTGGLFGHIAVKDPPPVIRNSDVGTVKKPIATMASR